MVWSEEVYLPCSFVSQEFTVAVGVTGATLRHKMAESDMSWISQVRVYLMDCKPKSKKNS